MDLGLKDKTIFVAGASRGIGLGIVEACLAEGAKVAITARGAEALEETRARLSATELEAPLDAVERAVHPARGDGVVHVEEDRAPGLEAVREGSGRGGGGAWAHLRRGGQCGPASLPARDRGG